MEYQDLKKKVKSMGERVTKDVRGKRVRLTINELRKKVKRDMKNRVNNARETIAMCKSIVSVGGRPAPPPPPPGVPKKPVVNNKRAKLMSELKDVLKKKGLRQN
jgi:pyruvate/2-oxoglutarate dehydrogenase complex dihydrolipoamide dehydrogenase (E3) component